MARRRPLTDRQRVALSYIVRCPGCLAKQLACEMGCGEAGARQRVGALRTKGLVSKRRIYATPAGAVALAALREGKDLRHSRK